MATMNINWKPGQSIIYAGTPIDEDGNIANNSNAVALVASDTLNPNAAEVITDGTWDEETNYHGITISDDCKRALPGIEFVGSDGEQHPATSLPTPKSDDAGKSAVVNEQGNAYALGAGGGGGATVVTFTLAIDGGAPVVTADMTPAQVLTAMENGPVVGVVVGEEEGTSIRVPFGVASMLAASGDMRQASVIFISYSLTGGIRVSLVIIGDTETGWTIGV